MKKLYLTAVAVALLLPVLPGGAQTPSASPTPTGSATPTSSATPTTSASPSPSVDATASPGASGSPSPSPTASAEAMFSQTDPEQIFAGRTLTRGLSLLLAGQGLDTGVTTTRVASDVTDECQGVACATAAGAAEPLGTTVMAMSPGQENPDPVEAGNFDPAEMAFAGQFGAATAMATDQPSAEGTADGLTLDVTLTQTIVSQLPAEVTDPLQGGIEQLTGALSPLVENDPTGVLSGVTETLNGLLDDLANSPLLSIQGGQSSSSSQFVDGVVTSTSASEGLIITLLPTPESTPLLPQGVAVIEVGSSAATATADGVNPATADATGSIARITLLPGVLDAIPDLDPGELEGLPLGDVIDMLPPEVTDLLPEQVTDLLGGGDDSTEEPTADPTATETGTEDDGPTGTPIDDILPVGMFMQADEDSGGFVIDLETGTEQTCILEDTPLFTCITLGGTSETFSEDGLGVGVLAAGAEVTALIDDTGQGQIALNVARSEAGAAADFVQAATPTPEPTPQEGMPDTGGESTFVIPALGLMAVGATALFGLRRRRDA